VRKTGIIHRDIKPKDVIVRWDGIVQALDFSLANLAEQPAVQADTYVRELVFLLE
jgi:serine/threonine protein kinase